MDRFWSKVDKTDADDCWLWMGARNPGGYGLIWWEGGPRKAHRVAYELLVGPIPGGLQLDHTCHTNDLECTGGVTCEHRACCNPAHLEPVTNRENSLRGTSFAANNARKTHCPQGHEYTPQNTYLLQGRRYCRACNRKDRRRQKRTTKKERATQ